jgi:Fe-Mn family superoxide dismutase
MLTRRSLVQTSVLVSLAAVFARASAWAADAVQPPAPAPVPGPFKLPPLPYDYAALEPHIDAKTMQIHHDKHHAGYVNNLNKAVADFPDVAKKSLEELCADWETLPEAIKTAVRNNGGGHFNHSFFWQMLSPKGGESSADLAKAIDGTFGSLDAFKDQFTKEAMAVFGSGWTWLVADKNKKLAIVKTPNQDTVLPMEFIPLLGVDVWEHAYYLKHQNLRADYLKDFWKVVNWTFVSDGYAKVLKS